MFSKLSGYRFNVCGKGLNWLLEKWTPSGGKSYQCIKLTHSHMQMNFEIIVAKKIDNLLKPGLDHNVFHYIRLFNPFPHIDAFWRLCSRRRFENIVTKEEIAQNVQFLLLPQCFSTFCHRLSIQLWRFSTFWQKTFKVVCCRIAVWGKGLNCIR